MPFKYKMMIVASLCVVALLVGANRTNAAKPEPFTQFNQQTSEFASWITQQCQTVGGFELSVRSNGKIYALPFQCSVGELQLIPEEYESPTIQAPAKPTKTVL